MGTWQSKGHHLTASGGIIAQAQLGDGMHSWISQYNLARMIFIML